MSFALELLFIIGLGLALGSFSTMFVYRLPRGEVAWGRYFGRKSRCPNCEAILQTRDLIPVFNWFITKGKCRHCGKPISLLYLFIESSMVVLFVLSFLRIGLADERIILFLAMSACLVMLTATDYTHKMFPRPVLNILLAVGLVNRTLSELSLMPILYSGFLAFIVILIGYKAIALINKEGKPSELADHFKFIAVASFWLSYRQFAWFMLTSILIYVFVRLVNKIFRKSYYLSYGYCLTISLAIYTLILTAL